MSVSTLPRPLHYVFRIANRKKAIDFYTGVLAMKVLRHEEFEQPCDAQCNGPYDGMWSKTMVGYGSEDEHFVLELTYNYGVKSYKNGNDLYGIYIASDSVLESVRASNNEWKDLKEICISDPDGHYFFVKDGQGQCPVTMISLNVKNLDESNVFWTNLCGMQMFQESGVSSDGYVCRPFCRLGFSPDQCMLELRQFNDASEKLDRGTAFGRIAFATQTEQLEKIEARVRDADPTRILTPLVSLDTPGKATVSVVILQDPNDHEICFVGDEAFRQLSAMDPQADAFLAKAIQRDHSDKQWR